MRCVLLAGTEFMARLYSSLSGVRPFIWSPMSPDQTACDKNHTVTVLTRFSLTDRDLENVMRYISTELNIPREQFIHVQ